MALDNSLYLVSLGIATRSGLLNTRYRTADGRYILDNNDLKRVRFTTDEYISGLQGVQKVTLSEAKELIKQNGYQMGLPPSKPSTATETEQNTDTGDTATETEQNTDTGDINDLNESLKEDEEKKSETISGEDAGAVSDVVSDTTESNDTNENQEESESKEE